MTILSPAERLIRIGAVAAEAISPFLASNAPTVGELDTWLVVFEADDKASGTRRYRKTSDPRTLLLILTRYWKHFRHPSTPLQTAWSKDLLRALNTAAHVPHELSEFDAAYYAGVAAKLLESFEVPSEFVARIESIAMPKAIDSPSYPGEPSSTEGEQDAPAVESPEFEVDAEFLPEPSQFRQNGEPNDAATLIAELTEEHQRDIDAQLMGSGHGLASVTETVGDARFTVVYRKALNFALVHNGVGPLVGIGVINTNSQSPLKVSSLHASLSSVTNDTNSSDTHRPNHDWFGPDIEIPPGHYIVLDGPTVAWELPATRFIDIDEATADTLEFEIGASGKSRQISAPVKLLAHDEWNATTVPELLAAFVRPRSESIGKILSNASDILERDSGDPSLVGYQRGQDRARSTAEAIYAAIRDIGVRYSEPPASFEETGQKLRGHDTVIEERFGTCIDLSILYAAALEEAGLNPVLIVAPGHAYAGVFLSDVSAPSFVVSERDQLSNLFGGELMLPVETTGFTAGSTRSFDEAVTQAYVRAAHGAGVTYVLDVRAAHRRVRPLPRVTGQSGARVVETIVTTPAIRTQRARTAKAVGRRREADVYPARVQRWRNDLLDLSLRNPLLKIADSRGLKLLVPPRSLGEFEDRLNSSEPIRLVPHDQLADIHLSRGVTSAQHLEESELETVFHEENAVYAFSPRYNVSRRLTALRREARRIKEETGSNSLFLALGSFHWKDSSGAKDGLAPLYLLPVQLTGSNSRPYEVFLEPGAEVQLNYCLIEKLRQEHGLTLDVLERPYEDDSGIDIDRILAELRDDFVSRGLDFSVDARVQLAILQYSTLDLWRDLSNNWQEFATSPIVEHLIEHPGENFIDTADDPEPAPLDEARAYLPVAADGSQLEAVRAASEGRTFVLEGPPGTGKSQTITNMIADGLAANRTILFVAEKQAALDVVHDRLRRIGLEPLVLNLHGQTQTLNAVREQLRSAIAEERRGNPDAFEVLRSHLREHIQDLSRYPDELHDRSTGASIWSQYQRCLQLESERPASDGWTAEEIDIPAATLEADEAEVDSLVRAVVSVARRTRGQCLAPEWSLISSDASSGPVADEHDHFVRAERIMDSATQFADAAEALPKELGTAYEAVEDRRDLLREWLAALQTGNAILPSQADQAGPDPAAISEMRQDIHAFQSQWSGLARILTPAARYADLDRLREQYREARTAGIFKRRKLERLAEDEIQALAVPSHADAALNDPLRFLGDIEAFRRDEHILTNRMQQVIGHCPGAPSDPGIDAELARAESSALERRHGLKLVRSLMESDPTVKESLDQLVTNDPARATSGTLLEALDQFESAGREFIAACAASPASLQQWTAGRSLLECLEKAIPVWRDQTEPHARAQTARLLHLQTLLHRMSSIGLGQVAEQIAAGRPAKDLRAAVELALARRRLNLALQKSGLDVFDDESYSESVSSYLRVSNQVKERMRSELAASLLDAQERRAAVTADLRKEIDRRRGGSIRSLFEKYGQKILAITPCILMSPGSVAKFLPPGSARFDTVIFDEASQIRVADAVGALGRAESAVIAGDSKQMPPTSMFSAGAAGPGDEGKDESDDQLLAHADQESILSEAVTSGLEQKWLSWHYRSRDESLIAFSNSKYYRGKLAIFPSPPQHRPGFGITSVFVGGTFDRGKTRTNEAEANAIVNAISLRLNRDPDASIGVITFNTEQRDLILDLLEQSTEETIRTALARDDEGLFVKNLENVQGDERDVILFSLAFSRDPRTGRLPLNFGPLNRSGGERRLNVAITRARTAVTLFSSFRSTDIDLARTSAEGVAHLKDYLMHAEKREAVGATQQIDDYNLYRERIAAALLDEGLEVTPDVGTSRFRVDLAVRASQNHGWLAVTLDSPEWAARSIVADREALPTTILKKVMGWQDTLQVLLPVWLRDPERVIEQISSAAQALELPEMTEGTHATFNEHGSAGPKTTTPQSEIRQSNGSGPEESPAPLAPEAHDSEADALSPMLVRDAEPVVKETETAGPQEAASSSGPYAFVKAATEVIGDVDVLNQLDSPAVRTHIATHLDEIVEVEGPIEAGRLAKVLARRFQLSRVRQARLSEILACTTKSAESSPFGRFYWPDNVNPETYAGYRPRLDGGEVAIHEISHREIANALVWTLRTQGEQSDDDLVREIAGVFGYNRLGVRIRNRLEDVITWAIDSGRMTRIASGKLAAL